MLDAALESLAERLEGGSASFPRPVDIARLIDPKTIQTPALELIDDWLVEATEAVERGEPRFVIISMPPQEGKSQRISRMFPIWCLKRNPDMRVAMIGYQDAISRRWGGQVRDDIQGHPELGLTIKQGSTAKNEWNLTGLGKGGMITTSIGGSLTGRHVDLMIIDDPHKDAKEAGSEVMIENIMEWWRTAASSRFGAVPFVILVQTRWHEQDLAGFLTSPDNEDSAAWRVLNIPAQAEHDPALADRNECKCGPKDAMGRSTCLGADVLGRAPGEYMISARGRTREGWEQRKRMLGSHGWAALCQGRPAPAEGSILKRAWWKYYDQPRAVEKSDGRWQALGADQVIMSVDCTFKDTKGSDYVTIGIWARRGPRMWLLEMIREKMDFVVTCNTIVTTAAKWPQATLKLIEDKANGPAVIAHLRSLVGGLATYDPKDSKEARAHACAPLVEAGNIELPRFAAFTARFVDECATFPNGAHDDQVDNFTQAAIRLLIEGQGGADWLAELEAEHRSPNARDEHGTISWTNDHVDGMAALAVG